MHSSNIMAIYQQIKKFEKLKIGESNLDFWIESPLPYPLRHRAQMKLGQVKVFIDCCSDVTVQAA